jgi:hypothetical protein
MIAWAIITVLGPQLAAAFAQVENLCVVSDTENL